MIIFLYGPDDYRREQKKKWYVSEFAKKYSGLSIGAFDVLEDGSTRLTTGGGLDGLKVFLRSQSIFEKKKLAVVENGFDDSVRDELAGILKPLPGEKNTTILISERKAPVKILNFLLEKPVISEEFQNLIGADLEMFARAEAKKLGFTLDNFAVQFLAQVYAGNTWGLVTELDKLANFKQTHGQIHGQTHGQSAITRRDLDQFDLEVAPNYFAVLNSLKSGDVRSRLWALEKMFAMGDPPPKIFNILASQWKEKISQLANYDLMVKSGKLEYDDVLVDLIISN
ncbi:MAG: hypothetical protein Q8P49_03000 [Candidatus Liptonbacteria bacterium]|nr:hypothetical protein [Candidatus Liptonbacteria bacterium]